MSLKSFARTGRYFFFRLHVSRQQERLCAERIVEDRRGESRAGRRDLLDHQGALEEPAALTPVFCGEGEVHDPFVPGSLENVEGQLVLFVVMPGDGEDLVDGKTARLVSQFNLFRGEREIQHRKPPSMIFQWLSVIANGGEHHRTGRLRLLLLNEMDLDIKTILHAAYSDSFTWAFIVSRLRAILFMKSSREGGTIS